jgi:multidrug efflux pump subunit AcrA (membrane-fusion protein)
MKTKRKIVWAVVLLAIVAVVGAGFAVWRSRAKARVPAGSSARVTRENMDVIVRTQGLIVAATTIEVKSRASGYVQAIHASAGDRVKKDQVLLEVDPSRSRLNEDEARNEVEAARSQVRLSEESLDPERIALLRKRLDRQRELEQKGLIPLDREFPKPYISAVTVLVALGVILLTGIAAGVTPAIRASRITPVEALRHE